MTKTKPSEAQIDKFRDAQRELETDQSQERFDAILKKVAKASSDNPAKARPPKQ
jgi:hypothetical protein